MLTGADKLQVGVHRPHMHASEQTVRLYQRERRPRTSFNSKQEYNHVNGRGRRGRACEHLHVHVQPPSEGFSAAMIPARTFITSGTSLPGMFRLVLAVSQSLTRFYKTDLKKEATPPMKSAFITHPAGANRLLQANGSSSFISTLIKHT